MKWLLALLPLAAAAPAFPNVELGDAPPPGQVREAQMEDFRDDQLTQHRSRFAVSAMEELVARKAP